MRYSVFVVAFFLVTLPATAAREHCKSQHLTDFYVSSLGQYHKVAKVVDPAGEQIALFDLNWGGILVSLKYQGIEHIASPSAVSGSQLILYASGYTPTMGGDDANRGSIVTGAACSANHLWVTSGMTDYNENASQSTGFVFRNNQWYFDHFTAPYVVSTYATFIPNPAGTPKYYLRVDRRVSNIDGTDEDATENIAFTFSASTSVPPSFATLSSQPSCALTGCTNGASQVTGGLYTSAARTTGLAVAAFPARDWSGQPGSVTVSTASFSDRRVLRLNRSLWNTPPQASRTYVTYLMVGSWANAGSFASLNCHFAVSSPPASVTSSSQAGQITVSSNSGCQWEASSDVPWIGVSPASGTGSGSVSYTIQANASGAARAGNVMIAGRVFPIFQSP